MQPQFYQKVLEKHFNPSQYLTMQLLILMLQSYRQVQLSSLANVFPQPILYESRIRNLQRFLKLPQLNIKLLWFPLIKHWLKQEFEEKLGNRNYRRQVKRLEAKRHGYLLLVMDRIQWKNNNIIMVTVICGKRALPNYWQKLPTFIQSDF